MTWRIGAREEHGLTDEQDPNGCDDGDDGDRTPTRGIRLVSRSAAGVANVALQIRESASRLSEVATVLGESAAQFDALQADEQEFLLLTQERIVTEVSDICHEYRRALTAIRRRHDEER